MKNHIYTFEMYRKFETFIGFNIWQQRHMLRGVHIKIIILLKMRCVVTLDKFHLSI